MIARFTALALGLALGTAQPTVSPWRTSLEQALTEAHRSGRMLMIDFRADWCVPCKLMEAQVYTPAFFDAEANRLIPLRVEIDRQSDLARRYHVEILPTVIFTDSWGGELMRHTGTLDPGSMAALVRALPADLSGLNHQEEVLAHGRNNADALAGMATQLNTAGLYAMSSFYFAQALKHGVFTREEVLDGLADNSLHLRQSGEAAKWLNRCLKEFPASGRSTAWKAELAELKGPRP